MTRTIYMIMIRHVNCGHIGIGIGLYGNIFYVKATVM